MIEMVIVMAIIAILIAIIVPQVMKQINRARATSDASSAKQIATALLQAIADGYVIPSTSNATALASVNLTPPGGGSAESAQDVVKKYLGDNFSFKTRLSNQDYYLKFTPSDEKIEIYTKTSDGNTEVMLYPTPDYARYK